MRAYRRLCTVVVVLLAAGAGVMFTGAPARADVTTASGQAFGATVRSGAAVLVPPTPARVDGAAIDPSDGYGPIVGTGVPLTIPRVLSIGALEAGTRGALVSGPGEGGFAASRALVTGLSVPVLSLGVTAVESQCSSGDQGSSGSTSLVGTVEGQGPLLSAPAPNTVLGIPGLVIAVANEQVVSDTPGHTSITVTGLHLQLLPGALGPGSALVDIVLAQSTCRASLAGGPPATPVPEPQFERSPAPPVPPTASTLPPPTTPPTPPEEPPGPRPPTTSVPSTTSPSSLVVSTIDGTRSGPPGATLRVSGTGYGSCDTVFFYFDGRRIGADHPDATGEVRKTHLLVPGGGQAGTHTVTSSCDSSGEPVHASTDFEVTSADLHRTALITSVPTAPNVDVGAGHLLLSGVVTLGFLFLIAFPSELFNSTYEANYDEVRGWFGLRPKDPDEVRSGRQGLLFLAFCIVGGAMYTLLSPDFDLSWSWLANVVGLGVAMALITLTYDLPSVGYFRRFGEHARLLVLPSTLVVAGVSVALSRVIGFQPGYFYGVVAGLAFRRQVGTDVKGRLVAVSAIAVLVLSATTFFLWSPVSEAAGRPGASFWVLLLDAFLAGIFWCGLDSMVLSLLPLRFLQGRDLQQWSRAAWAVLYGLTLFAFVHIMLRPSTGYVADTRVVPLVVAIGLFVGFGVFSFAFWGYFRFRRGGGGTVPQ